MVGSVVRRSTGKKKTHKVFFCLSLRLFCNTAQHSGAILRFCTTGFSTTAGLPIYLEDSHAFFHPSSALLVQPSLACTDAPYRGSAPEGV